MNSQKVRVLERRIETKLCLLGLRDQDVEDVRQQVLEAFLRKADSVENPLAWVTVVAYRMGLHRRHARRFEVLEDHLEPMVEPRAELRLDVRRALASSSPEHRALISARFVDGNTVHEMSELGLGSVSTIKRQTSRAARSLRTRLARVKPGQAAEA